MYPANAFRAELRERGFQFLAAEVEGIMDTMQKDWFHKPCDRKTLKKICPDFTEAHMRFGDIKVPHADVQHIFFGFEGYVHQNLYGWKRAAGRARDLLGAHKSGMIPPPDMQGHGDHGGSGGLSHTTSAPVTLPQTTSTTANSANHADEMVPDLWVGDIPQYQANEPCLRDIFEKFGGVSLIYFRSKPNTAAANEPRSWAYITFAGEKPARAKCVNAAKILPIVVKNEQDEDVTLKVEVAERDKAVSVSAGFLLEFFSHTGRRFAPQDVVAKHLKCPVYQLIGGAVRHHVPVYVTCQAAMGQVSLVHARSPPVDFDAYIDYPALDRSAGHSCSCWMSRVIICNTPISTIHECSKRADVYIGVLDMIALALRYDV